MNKYNKNIMYLVATIKDTFTKDEAGVSTTGVDVGNRVTILTKPTKVPSWLKDMSLEIHAKQVQT